MFEYITFYLDINNLLIKVFIPDIIKIIKKMLTLVFKLFLIFLFVLLTNILTIRHERIWKIDFNSLGSKQNEEIDLIKITKLLQALREDHIMNNFINYSCYIDTLEKIIVFPKSTDIYLSNKISK